MKDVITHDRFTQQQISQTGPSAGGLTAERGRHTSLEMLEAGPDPGVQQWYYFFFGKGGLRETYREKCPQEK